MTSELKTIQFKNNQKKEYCWKCDYDKWLITNNNKEQKTIKQFLMISVVDKYYDKYLELSLSTIKGIFSFYLNLLWRVNGVRNHPDNVKYQPEYDAKLSYSTLFNKCIPIDELNAEAKTKGYKCGADLFAEEHKHDTITMQIKYALTKKYAMPFLDELQRIGLIKYQKTLKTNGSESQQFLIKITNKARYSYEENKHYNFLIIPYLLLFDTTKVSNAGLFSFISAFNYLHKIGSKKDDGFIDFNKIVKDFNIDIKICKLLNKEYNTDYSKIFADNLQNCFIDLMENSGLKQGNTIITDISECNGRVEEINNHKYLIMSKISEILNSKNTDKYDEINNKLFWYVKDFTTKTNIIVNKVDKKLIFIYNGCDPTLIGSVFDKYYCELEGIVKGILKWYYCINSYSVKFYVNRCA
jgi:hypothetical protein